jgi:hypothetical protein
VSSVRLGQRELELLEKLVVADEQQPDKKFSVAYLNGGATRIIHPGWEQTDPSDDSAALMALDAAGLLLVEYRHSSKPSAFYMPGAARAELEAAKAVSSAPSALAASEARVAGLEAALARERAPREAFAAQVGTWAFRASLTVLVLVVIGLAAWAAVFSSIAPGVLAVILVGYALLTDAWGWTARGIARRIEVWVAGRVLAALEPND